MSFLKDKRARLQVSKNCWAKEVVQAGHTVETKHPRGAAIFEAGNRYNLNVIGIGARKRFLALRPAHRRHL